ncbi:hypothetical protein [Psychroflexus sp. MES1-P1E]|uniref:hypothetical protein n=1 Tax=Psychroflexus sp. MES1-P1E TaxID=2058320 RepID=UPI0011AEBC9E|nr:hypothetical protein [Psychroflexus sp. MES1-P1E]
MLSEIKTKEVILFPDAGKFALWASKIQDLPKSNFYEVSDLLHSKSTEEEKRKDFDIADYCLRVYLNEIYSVVFDLIKNSNIHEGHASK